MSTETPSPPTAGRKRTRAVIVLTSLLTLLVMGGVIAIGLAARRDAAADGPFAGRWADRYRNVPWETEGCEPDRDHPARLVFELPPEGLDFGAVKQGVVLEEDVVFRNEGTGTLCIREVDPGCGCVKTVLEGNRRVYEPGEQGSIRIHLDTEGRERVDKTVSVYTNELDRPLRTFSVKATVSVGLIATPKHLTLPPVLAGQPSTGSVRLRSAAAETEWEVVGVEGRVKIDGETIPYTWDVVPMKDPNHRILDVRITHPGRDTTGPFQDALVIRTTHPERPEVGVRVHFRVVDPILSHPPDLPFGYVPAPERKLRLRLLPGTDDIAFEVEDVRFEVVGEDADPRDAEGFAATPVRGPDGVWFVDVVYRGQPRTKGPFTVRMIVTTDHPDQREIAVPVTATGR